MQVREYSLAEGWYPKDPNKVAGFLSGFSKQEGQARAAIAPHAGWAYSGRLAALALCNLERDAETLAVLGGHLPGESPALFAMEDALRTPFGAMPVDKELRSAIMEVLAEGSYGEDRFRDNTIEVLLPMLHFFFPNAKVLWLRLGADASSFAAGQTIEAAAKKLKRKINVLASADLTHWGKNFGFTPLENSEKALQWVKDVNDKNFIRAVERGEPSAVLKLGEANKASCSSGAVLGAMGFAQAAGLPKARLLEYATSADSAKQVPDTFVGYAAMVFG
ncbi:MAG: AmmeMemoRadiSam system protein B [Spirochaetes bacterium]|nr:AmmeMemoRadiSam system protein B [Spirochaetota bacterium]